MFSILIVDDDTAIHEMLAAVLHPQGLKAVFATDGAKALEHFKAEHFDLVLADLRMKPMDGMTLLQELKRIDPKVVVIVMTAHADTSNALNALKLGAFDFLQKPFKVDDLISAVKRGIDFKQHGGSRAKKSGAAKSSLASSSEKVGRYVLGESKKIKQVVAQLKKLTASKTPVLIVGETGTGKQEIAGFIHEQSCPPGSPLIRFDCTMVGEPGLRTGLIGSQGREGIWTEQARGGMLCLENINAVPLAVQKELVGVVRKVGNALRLVCLSTEDLEKHIESGEFNEELFYRIASLPLVLPPLRERTDDIAILAKSIAATVKHPHFDTTATEFDAGAMALLTAYNWPGNVIECDQIIASVVASAETNVITAEHFPARLAG